jgi:hypothetical protein
MSGFEVTPASLRSSGDGLDRAAQDVDAAAARFLTTSQALGECWGSDDLGWLVSMAYLPVHGRALDCFDVNAEDLADYGSALLEMAERYERTELEVTESLQRLGRDAGLEG